MDEILNKAPSIVVIFVDVIVKKVGGLVWVDDKVFLELRLNDRSQEKVFKVEVGAVRRENRHHISIRGNREYLREI